jgi:hypothetical protein
VNQRTWNQCRNPELQTERPRLICIADDGVFVVLEMTKNVQSRANSAAAVERADSEGGEHC